MICGIKFKDTGKTYYFKNNGLELNKNQTVVVGTEKGEQFGKVVDINVENFKNLDMDSMKDVLRISTKKDYDQYLNNLKDAQKALEFAKNEVTKLAIEMNLVDASYTLDRKQLTFNFIADDRVDFRELVKSLAAKYKARIELHQMGIRDKSRDIGGIGICGHELCCSKIKGGLETISINMAKNQNIALNPTKINGACGRLLCCLAYEDEVYKEHRTLLPKIGEVVKTPNGEGKVVQLDILKKQYTVQIDDDKFTFDI